MNEAERRWARCLEAVHHQMSPHETSVLAAERARDPALARDWAEAVRLDQRLSALLTAAEWSEQELEARVERLYDQAHAATATAADTERVPARRRTWLWFPAAAVAAAALWMILAGGHASAPAWPPARVVTSAQRGPETPAEALDAATVQRLDARLREAVLAAWAHRPSGGPRWQVARVYHDLVGPALRIEVTVTSKETVPRTFTSARVFADPVEGEAGLADWAREIAAAGMESP
jgi:hypothetical protein